MKKTIKIAKTQASKKTAAKAAPKRSAGNSGSRTTPAATAPVRKTAIPAEAPGAMLQAIEALRVLVQSRLPAPVSGDQALEGSVDSLRRLLSELVEARTESVARDVADVRSLAVKTGAQPGLVEAFDALLAKLGALRFEARRLDFVDPLIHRAVADRADAGAADGVILEAVQPGYKTARGIVLSRADVVVNRRN